MVNKFFISQSSSFKALRYCLLFGYINKILLINESGRYYSIDPIFRLVIVINHIKIRSRLKMIDELELNLHYMCINATFSHYLCINQAWRFYIIIFVLYNLMNYECGRIAIAKIFCMELRRMDGAINIRDNKTGACAARIGEAVTSGPADIIYGGRGDLDHEFPFCRSSVR